MCGASTNLRFSIKDDCKPLLLEQWNKRTDEAVRMALKYLVNEIMGSLPLMEQLCRREFGNTNYQCIMDRAAEAEKLLAETAK